MLRTSLSIVLLLWAMSCGVAALSAEGGDTLRMDVQAEMDVYTFTNPNNGSGLLWSYGCTQIARMGNDVVISQMETGKDIPPLSNTRWRLLRREGDHWALWFEPDGYRQREPAPVAVISDKELFLYVNDSTQPPGTKYGNCVPHLLEFVREGHGVAAKIMPQWKGEPYFTDHSYRGYAADRQHDELLMLNIDAKTSIQHAALLKSTGETIANGSITFPIRACYPQVALVNEAVHVLAVGDIVEPNAEWKQYKFDQTKSGWDYVFRILYYTSTSNLRDHDFGTPLEIANVDATAGHISNHDLWISPEGDAYILYGQREVASSLLRDRFFPGKSTIDSLHLAIIKDGAVVSRRTLLAGTEQRQPGVARFHVAADGKLYVVLFLNGTDGGNKLAQIYPPREPLLWTPIPLKKPLSGFCLASVRAGNVPSNTIDMFGIAGGDIYSYAELTLVKP